MDCLPFVVKYKSGTDKSIKPGIAGRFETMEEAVIGLAKCAKHFGSEIKKSATLYAGPAICGIVVDQAALAKQKEYEDNGDDLKCDLPEPEQSELDRLKAENARLRAKAGEENEEGDEECEELSDSESEEAPKPAKSRKSQRTSSTVAV